MNTGQKRDMEEFIFSANCNGSFTQYKTLFTFQQSEVNYMAIFSCELCWKLRPFLKKKKKKIIISVLLGRKERGHFRAASNVRYYLSVLISACIFLYNPLLLCLASRAKYLNSSLRSLNCWIMIILWVRLFVVQLSVPKHKRTRYLNIASLNSGTHLKAASGWTGLMMTPYVGSECLVTMVCFQRSFCSYPPQSLWSI